VVKELALQKVKDGLVIIYIEEWLPWYAFDAKFVGGCRYLKWMWSESRQRKGSSDTMTHDSSLFNLAFLLKGGSIMTSRRLLLEV
jgi:hypothetical protein